MELCCFRIVMACAETRGTCSDVHAVLLAHLLAQTSSRFWISGLTQARESACNWILAEGPHQRHKGKLARARGLLHASICYTMRY